MSEDFDEDTKVVELDVSEADEIKVYAKFIQVLYYNSSSGTLTGITDYGKQKTEIEIPESCTEISLIAFHNATKLEKVDASKCENLKTIGTKAFYTCVNLKEVLLPKNIEEIGSCAFSAETISKLQFPNGSINYIIEDNCLINKTTKTLQIAGINPSIPSGIEIIGEYAFSLNKEITKINIPDSVKILKSHAFANCHNIEEINILDNSRLQIVEKYAFGYCYKLKTINLPSGVHEMGNGVFANCENLQSFSYPAGMNVKVISYSMFYGCKSLKSIVIPEGVEVIEDDAFANCSSLTTIVIPDSVKRIGGDAFRDSKNLKSATISGEWKIKPHCRQSVKIDAQIIEDKELFAKSLTTNYIASRYIGDPYMFFEWIKI
ncbi:MAG: leucine-rich repeat domain-containing protein [Clostridia bacterium]|nr:leucine-rich repeat domain-containing protein [Clostridia bacterium]